MKIVRNIADLQHFHVQNILASDSQLPNRLARRQLVNRNHEKPGFALRMAPRNQGASVNSSPLVYTTGPSAENTVTC